jgi:hypothetical protein
MTVSEVWIPPPIDLGPPLPGEPIRKVSYWYVRSYPDSFAKYLHLYELDPQDPGHALGGAAPASCVGAAGRVGREGGPAGIPGLVWRRARSVGSRIGSASETGRVRTYA